MTIHVDYKTYPGLGRQLTENDVGKNILRVYPRGRECGFLPFMKNGDPNYTAVKLISFNKDNIEVKIGWYGVMKLDKNWMDGNWLTLDEYFVKTQAVAATIYTHVDSDPPY